MTFKRGLFVALAVCLCSRAAADQRPNVVLLLADDLDYGDLACYGAPDTRTPHLDRLAAEGVRFTQHYANAPECTPTRTALMTGRYQQRIGGLECAIGTGNVGRYDDAMRLAEQHELGLPAEEAVLPRAMVDAGYRAVIFGKWHLGYEPKFNPLRSGWERFVGIISGNADYFRHTEDAGDPVFFVDDRRATREGYLTNLITDEAVRLLGEKHERPFLLYVPYTSPHLPYQGPDDDIKRPLSREEFSRGTRAGHIKLVESLDEQIGRILAAIDEQGLSERTLVIFASDNGAARSGRNLPFAGYKGGLMEGGIRVPLIVRWPGRLPGGTTCSQVCVTMDLTASLLRVAEAKPLADRPLEGIDILAHVEQGRADFDRTLFWRARRGDQTWRAVRDGDLKYVRRTDSGVDEQWLFDVAADPGEMNNLLAARPADGQRLKGLLTAWEQEVRPRR